MSAVRVIEKPRYWLLNSPLSVHGRFTIPRDGRWTFDGNYERPTFSPSVNESWSFSHEDGTPGATERNHYFVRNGFVEYLSDCTHQLAGQTVELGSFTEVEVEYHAAYPGEE